MPVARNVGAKVNNHIVLQHPIVNPRAVFSYCEPFDVSVDTVTVPQELYSPFLRWNEKINPAIFVPKFREIHGTVRVCDGCMKEFVLKLRLRKGLR